MQNTPKNEKSQRKNLRYIILLVGNTTIFFTVYRVLLNVGEVTGETFYAFLSMILYMALLVGFSLAYLIYNRFFLQFNLTEEELPDTLTLEEKQAFIEEGRRRKERSKWMLTFIFPLIFTFLSDAVDLFIFDTYFR